jgi:hypothetical protein
MCEDFSPNFDDKYLAHQSTWVPHVFTLIRKEELALQKQQLPWRRLYRGGKPPEDGCMKPKHVV